jgi:predicted ribosomally synthesized peptide with SipW-like signal peptide
VLKKLIGLSLAALILLSLTATGTWAFFRDTETAKNNTLTAGTLNLQVGAADPMGESILIENIRPGDAHNLASWSVRNKGSLSGGFSVSVETVNNAENGRSEVEIASGDLSDVEGELGDMITLALWMDNGAGGWSSGDYYLNPSGGSLTRVPWAGGSSLPAGAYFMLNSFSATTSAVLQIIAANSTAGNFRVDLIFPENGANDNRAQSDNCTFNILFSLKQ